MKNQVIAYYNKNTGEITKAMGYFEGEHKIDTSDNNISYKVFDFDVSRGVDLSIGDNIDSYEDDGTRKISDSQILDNGVIRDRTDYELVEVGLLDEAVYDAAQIEKRKAAYRENTDPEVAELLALERLAQDDIDGEEFSADEKAEIIAKIKVLRANIKASYPRFAEGKPPVIEETEDSVNEMA